MNSQEIYHRFLVLIKIGQTGELRRYVREGFNLETTDYENCTPLHHAAMCRHSYVVSFLLVAGANVHAIDDRRFTPLHYAVGKNRLLNVELLLEKGANVNAKNFLGSTPLHHYIQYGSMQHEPIVRALLKAGANINAIEDDGWTPLHVAVLNNREAVVQILLENNADYTICTGGGKTARDLAVEKEFTPIALLLLLKEYEDIPDIKEPVED